jgi:hypothetical protein
MRLVTLCEFFFGLLLLFNYRRELKTREVVFLYL